MDFSSSQSGSSATQFNPEAFKSQYQNQLAQAYAEEFLETLKTKCFDKCITKPGSSLGSGESSCISRCMDRYIEATSIIRGDVIEKQEWFVRNDVAMAMSLFVIKLKMS